MMAAHAFVTGATGLIGRWLVPALTRRGYVVYLADFFLARVPTAAEAIRSPPAPPPP